MIWRVGEDGESGPGFTPWATALTGTARPQSLPAFDGHRIAKGLPLAAGSMGVAHATRICALVLNLPFCPQVGGGFRRREDNSLSLQLAARLSTDAEGISACLGLQAEARVELEQIVMALQAKISPATLFAPV